MTKRSGFGSLIRPLPGSSAKEKKLPPTPAQGDENSETNVREKARSQIQAIEGHFRQAITGRVLFEGDRLPTERQLARDFGASRASVRSALAGLARAKLIER